MTAEERNILVSYAYEYIANLGEQSYEDYISGESVDIYVKRGKCVYRLIRALGRSDQLDYKDEESLISCLMKCIGLEELPQSALFDLPESVQYRTKYVYDTPQGAAAETDPTVPTHVKSITTQDILNWDDAYSWGDHALAGYVTSETDPTVPSHVKAILVADITNWNTAYGWGDHAAEGYLTVETDPTVGAHIKAITSGQIANWDAVYTDALRLGANLGSGEGIYSGLSGTTFQLKSLSEGSTKVDIASTATEVTVDIIEANITHDNLAGVDPNEHIDHTAVSISAGTGLTGGGTIDQNRSLSLQHLGLENLVDPNIHGVVIGWNDTTNAVEWVAGASTVWGAITGTLSNQTDLQAALDSKAPAVHTHDYWKLSGTSTLLGSSIISGNASFGYDLDFTNMTMFKFTPGSQLGQFEVYSDYFVVSNAAATATRRITHGASNTTIQNATTTVKNENSTHAFLTYTSGGGGYIQIFNSNSAKTYSSDMFFDEDNILAHSTGGGIFFESSNPNFQGVKYWDDYSSNYVNRSLVDKEYVDGAVSSGAAGSDTQVQYNNGGVFGGATMYWDDAANRLGINVASPASTLDIDGDILLGDIANQRLNISNENSRLTIQSQTSGDAFGMWLFSKDGDGTDNSAINIFGLGTPSTYTTASHLGTIGYIASDNQYQLYTNAIGTGTVKPLNIYAGLSNKNQLFLNTDGNVGINQPNPQSRLHIGINSSSQISSSILRSTADHAVSISNNNELTELTLYCATTAATERGILDFTRSKGSLTTPLAVIDDDYVGNIVWSAYDGSGMRHNAEMGCYVDGAVSSGTLPIRMEFWTGDVATRYRRMVIKADGRVGINTTADPADSKFHISKDGVTPASSIQRPTYATYVLSGDGYIEQNFTVASSVAGQCGLFGFIKSRGTPASPATVVDGDKVATIFGTAYSSALYSNASIDFDVDGAVSGSTIPMSITFKTGTTSPRSDSMTITSTGVTKIHKGRLQVLASVAPLSGAGLELAYGDPNASLIAYDRDASGYKNLRYNAALHDWEISGVDKMLLDTSGYLWLYSAPANADGSDDILLRDSTGVLTKLGIGTNLSVSGGNLNASGGLWSANGSKIYYNSGLVGIGTNNPQYGLEVRTAGSVIASIGLLHSSGYGLVLAGTSGASLYPVIAAVNDTSTGRLMVESITEPADDTGSEPVMIIRSGRGTGTMTAALTTRPVISFRNYTTEVSRIEASNVTRFYYGTRISDGVPHIMGTTDADDIQMYYHGTNNNGVFNLRGEGSILFQDDASTKFTFTLTGASSGDATATDWISTSDIHLKTNLKPYGSVLDKVGELGTELLQAFNWIDTGRKDVGYVAQWLQPIFPEFVSNNSGELGIRYGKLSIVALQAINELRAEYQKRIDKQDAYISKLEDEIYKIKNFIGMYR
jgi:hypothetical protein